MLRHAIVYDKDGADPVGSKIYDELMELKTFEVIKITSSMALNPWLISENYYDTAELSFLILGYNGLIHARELTIGKVIKVPLRTNVLQVLTKGKKPTGTRIAAI